jgi:predicted kinase
MEAVIFVGLQASGKSTFYKERFFDTHVRINLDMLKTRRRESLLVRACLEAHQPFVVDNTNILAADRAVYIEAARAAGFHVVGYFFQTTVSAAIGRNARREGKARIPPQAIGGAAKRLQPPALAEGFAVLYHVHIAPEGGFVVDEQSPAPAL